jgi:hypothetical protein
MEADDGGPPPPVVRAFGDPREGAVFLAPLPRLGEPSYLDDPVEQRRYALRWALTIVVLGVLAIGLVWALGQLGEGWGALLDLFRSHPATGGMTNAAGLLGAV